MMRPGVVLAALLGLVRASAAGPQCKADKTKLKWPEHAGFLAVDNAVLVAHWDAKQGVVLTNWETGKAVGKALAVPASPVGRILTLLRTDEGIAAIVRLSKSADDDAGRVFIARFSLDGTPIGAAHELSAKLAPLPMPGFDVVAAGTRLVLLEETELLSKTHVQVIDLDGKAVGKAIDGEAGRIGEASPIGVNGSAVALMLRDGEGGEERVRVFDTTTSAWAGPATKLGQMNIYGVVPFQGSALLMGVGNQQIAGATIGSDGKLSPWKRWKKLDYTEGGKWISASPDGKRAFIEYTVGPDHKQKDVLAIVQPNLTIKDDLKRPAAGFSSGDRFVTASAIYEPAGDDYRMLRCK